MKKSINVCDLGCCARDYISNLPEDVLSEILSRLPAKDAVRTSTLSKAWEYKWTSMYNVDIDDDQYQKNLETVWKVIDQFKLLGVNADNEIFPDHEGNFANFIDRIIRSCKHVKKFSLRCGGFYDQNRAQAWISAALRHKLESFEVSCPVLGVVYPCSLFNIASLRNLELQNGTLYVAAKKIAVLFAANLTRLDLYNVRIVNEYPSTSTIAFTFPLLETLRVQFCSWLEQPVEINAPSLTTFSSSSRNDWVWDPTSFALIAPRLAKFDTSYGYPDNFILTGSTVVSATMHSKYEVIYHQGSDPRIGISIGNLLNQLKNVEQLDLGKYVIEVRR